MENADGKSFNLAANSATCCQASCKGNPATTDWIPAATDKVQVNSGFLSIMFESLFLLSSKQV